MEPRFRWQRDGKGGFVAYPDGETFPDRRAQISRNPASGMSPWRWWAGCDTAKLSGVAATQQDAADAVRAAWPGLAERAEAEARKAADEEALRTLVKRMASKGDLSLEVFEIGTSSNARLEHIIWLLQYGGLGSIDGPAKPLVEACSVELGRRVRGGRRIDQN